MSSYNKIRVVKNGKVIEERDFRPSAPALKVSDSPSEEKVQHVPEMQSEIDRIARMFGLGKYGEDLATEILEKIYQLGFHHGVAEAIEVYGLDS